MLALSRAIMAAPRLILLDEPSLGLSPRLTQEIFEIVMRINREHGTSILLVEQNANMALNVADRAYIMENGRVVMEGVCSEAASIAGHRQTGAYSHGDQPTMADLCLAPQVFNAQRFKVDMARFPTIQRIFTTCMAHPAFDAAQPSRQPDAEP